ncbi:response regulator transcription factor [Malaciobacter marinus]|uniref:response regulator transcription factor n=1 Tax=Malaciobacter marinus TaxID=505249 RepID=UPI003B00DBAE
MLKEEYKKLKVLYVEDEDFIRANAVSYLKRFFHDVYEANDAYMALELIEKKQPHLVITDIKMPKLSGLDMIRRVRQTDEKTQFIVISAFTNKDYLLDAIDLGLVKYLSKPIKHDTIFPLLLKCAKNSFENENNKKFINETTYFDNFEKLLKVDEQEIKLTKSEMLFLELLCVNSPKVVSYEQIQEFVWEDEFMSDNAIRLLVRDLRKKLPCKAIKNVSKIGYKIELLK